MKVSINTAAGTGIGAALGLPYAQVLVAWISQGGWYPSSILEALVFGSIFLRLGLFFLVPAIRRLKVQHVTILFGTEIYLVLGSAGAFAATGDPAYGAFATSFVSAWLGASAVLIPPLAIFMVVKLAATGGRLAVVLPGSAGAFGALAFLALALSQGQGGGGLSGVSAQVLQAMKGSSVSALANPAYAVSSGLLFVSLMAYATLVRGGARASDWIRPVAAAVASTLASTAWAAFFLPLAPAWEVLGLPVLAMVGVVWVVTRGP